MKDQRAVTVTQAVELATGSAVCWNLILILRMMMPCFRDACTNILRRLVLKAYIYIS